MTDGLSASQVTALRAQFGWNEFAADEPETFLEKLRDQFRDPLILLLLASATVSALLGSYDDAISIAAAISIVVTVAIVQELRSEKSLAELTRLLPPSAHALRDGVEVRLEARELVPGDIVLLALGDRVPADCVIIAENRLQVDESSLTGETEPSTKAAVAAGGGEEDLPENEEEGNRFRAFMGTMVVGGNARGRVSAVGESTVFGKIFAMVQSTDSRKTPLQRRMDQLGRQLSAVSFAIIAAIAAVGLLQGKPLLEVFTIGVSLAVAAIPEGLPICVTVTLALGVLRMARRQAIVKKLPAVEVLGCATYVCVDKTGTLTTNQMVAAEAQGLGDAAPAALTAPLPLSDEPHLRTLLEVAVLCNNANVNTGGTPTETALLRAALEQGLPDLREQRRRTSETPFCSDSKMMRVGCEDGETYFKGAVQAVLRDCLTYRTRSGVAPLKPEDHQRAERLAAEMGSRGLRVLALGYGSTFAGLVGLQDPPRATAAASVRAVREGGVAVVMITGDQRETAVAIARQVGILSSSSSAPGQGVDDGLLLSGAELRSCPDDALRDLVLRTRVYYRTSPDQKQRIVAALQERGEVVAMTGDGVNDAPALTAADIGIAMGRTGTDVAKEAACMILLDDDFSTILHAIEEGKGIYFNIRNFLRFQLSTSVAALGLIALSTAMGLENPLNAMQILWINIIMDGPPAQTLGVEPVEADVMRQPPRDPSTPIISRGLLARVLSSAVVIVTCTLWVFFSELADGVVTARDTTMTFTCFVFCDLFNALASRSATKSIFRLAPNKPLFLALTASVVGQLLVIYWAPLRSVFQTEELSRDDLVYLVGISSSVLVVDELRKVCCASTALPPAAAARKTAEDRL